MNLVDPQTLKPFDRLPPCSVEAEMCALGALMLACGDDAIFAETRAPLTAESFYQVDHQIIFRAICDLRDRNVRPDGMLLREELIRLGQLEEVGGVDYLARILDAVPSAANGPHYAGIVAEKAALRSMIALCNDYLRQAWAPNADPATQMAAGLSERASQLAVRGTADTICTLGDAARLVLGRSKEAAARRVPTLIGGLDDLIGGLPRGKFSVVGAEPRVGKSQLIKQVGLNLARRGVKFGLVSVEEDREKIAENMLANVSGVENNRIAFGTMDDAEADVVRSSADQIQPIPYFIEDAKEEIGEICVAVQRLVLKYGCEVVAVDHLHLITGRAENREQELAKISKALKLTFKRLNVAGLAAAQLNRAGHANEKPTLKSLRGSGSIEADADVVLLLWREDLAKQYEQDHQPNYKLTVIVAKNKDGRMGEVDLHVSGATQRVSSDPADPFRATAQEAEEYGL